MKERKTLKQVYEQHTDAIQITMFVVIAIALFVTGYLISFNCWHKPLNDNQFELCEKIARDVYEQKEQIIVEAPEDFSVDITTTTITVKATKPTLRGEVIAKLQNGELVMERNMQTGDAIFRSILIGVLFVLVPILVLSIGFGIYEKIQKKK